MKTLILCLITLTLALSLSSCKNSTTTSRVGKFVVKEVARVLIHDAVDNYTNKAVIKNETSSTWYLNVREDGYNYTHYTFPPDTYISVRPGTNVCSKHNCYDVSRGVYSVTNF